MKEQKKKIIIASVIGGVTVAALTIAAITANRAIDQSVKSGTVEVKSINLQLKDENGNETKNINNWDPGDIQTITWKVENVGTAAVYTRNRLKIYWNEDVEDDKVLYLYPANMSKAEIMEDYKSADTSKYEIKVDIGNVTASDNSVKKGFEYVFAGDSLDGTEMTVEGEEVNYNSPDFENKTDDNSKKEDNIAFNILLSPNTPYLYGDKSLTVEVITEAMQHTEEGKNEWKIVGTQTLGK